MDNQKLIDIDKAIKSKRGLIGEGNESADVVLWDGNEFYLVSAQYAKTAQAMGEGDVICTIDEYKKRARELGWVNGYKWGVEYPTNGKKPDLPDDVKVVVFDDNWQNAEHKVCYYTWEWYSKFRIVDERFKPKAEQSCASKNDESASQDVLSDKNETQNNWHERGDRPPVGTVCEVIRCDWGTWEKCEILFSGELVTVFKSESRAECAWDNEELKFRPIKTERESFIETFVNILKENPSAFTDEQIADLLYDLGFRAPEGLK